MCGIFGVIHFNGKPIDTQRAEQAATVLSHRGPDDYGTFHSPSGRAFFCHYRLKIIELSTLGHQPMHTGDGRYTILYNGETYNYKSIKNSGLVNNLKTNSDTEVILKLFAKYGENCLNNLRGMFAFAIWDENDKSLFTARDRFGIKPFYYLLNKNEFIFSSELNAIKRYKPGLKNSQNALELFLKTGSVPAPFTIYEGVKSLLPGEYSKINIKGESFFNKWWSYEHLLNISDSNYTYNQEARREIKAALEDSIKAHCISDVEVGAFLSGGIDSTSVVSLMKQTGQNKIRTVSISFPGSSYDESRFAALAAETYGISNTNFPLTEDQVINDLDKFFDLTDQPTIDGLNVYFISKAAASLGLKVVMSGLGGDELFGGYSTFKNIPRLRFINRVPFSRFAMNLAAPVAKPLVKQKLFEYLKDISKENAAYKLHRGLFTDNEIKNLNPDFLSNREDIPLVYNNHLGSGADNINLINSHSALKYVSYLETTNYMANQLLRDSDKFSMCHSIELRVPFVDERLYSVVLKYLESGYDKNKPKRILTDAVGDLPPELINRKKMGFTFPFDEWIRKGKLGKIVKESITSGDNGFSSTSVEKLIEGFDNGKVHWSRLWALFVLNRFKDKIE